MNLATLWKPAAGLVIRSKEVELLVMQGRKVSTCLRVPVEGREDADLIHAIRKVLAASGVKPDQLAVSIQSRDVLFRFFTMPLVPKAEWDTAVQFEARKYNPFRTETLFWDYRATRLGTSNQLEVIFSGIPKESFQRLLDVFTEAGIQPVLVEPRSMSLARLVEPAKGSLANEFTCVVDLEQDAAHLVIVKNHIPFMTRDVNLVSAAGAAAEGAEATSGAADPRAQRLLSELSVSVGFFLREYPSTTIPRVLLCGEERVIGPWCAWLSEQLHCTVELGGLLLAQRVQGGLPLSFASAVGLLLALKDPGGASLDFLKRAVTKAPSAQHGSGMLGNAALTEIADVLKTPQAAVCAALAIGFLAACWTITSVLLSKERQALNQVAKVRPDLGWGLKQMTADDLTPIQQKAQQQMALLKQIVDQRMSVTAKLDALARSLPDGVWLTELSFDDVLETTGKGQPQLKVNGACFLGEPGRELTAIQKFEEQIKQNRSFASGFTDARLGQIGGETQQTDRQYTYRTFQLNCNSERKL